MARSSRSPHSSRPVQGRDHPALPPPGRLEIDLPTPPRSLPTRVLRPHASSRSEGSRRRDLHELDPLAFAEGKDEVTARALLKDRGVSLTEAARTWLTKEEKPAKTGTVKELRSQWLGFLANDGYHDRRSLEDRTLHFEKGFGDRQISTITSDEVFLWLLSLKKEALSPRTIRNIYDASKRFFAFARSAGYLNSASLTVLQQIKRPRAGAGKKEIYTPEVEQLLLDAAWASASPGAVPLAITSFSAIRTKRFIRRILKSRESRASAGRTSGGKKTPSTCEKRLIRTRKAGWFRFKKICGKCSTPSGVRAQSTQMCGLISNTRRSPQRPAWFGRPTRTGIAR